MQQKIFRPKSIHFIGICGVTMAPLAVLYKQMGWRVTGSDRAFFPPMSTYLEKNGIVIMPGFKENHLNPHPDLVLVMAFITDKNPEVVAARKLNIPIRVYADVLPELIEKENSVVIAGDCGKTSTTALIAWVLEMGGYNPNFMIGGIAKNFEHGIRRTDSDWSVLEGDEYPASSWNNTPRFLSYNPRYLILTGIHWDHMDKYPSATKYLNIFRELVRRVPRDGMVIAHKNDVNVQEILKDKSIGAKILFYSAVDSREFSLPFPGRVWQENCAAAIALARHLGIQDKIVKGALATFLGLKRRQEVRFMSEGLSVIDDNAHTPVKVAGGLEAISKMFAGYNLCVIYEPGNRSASALMSYDYRKCFKLAEKIILPQVSSASEEARDFNKNLSAKIANFYKDCSYIDADHKVIAEIKEFVARERHGGRKAGIVFMSQKGFRGMIEETIQKLR